MAAPAPASVAQDRGAEDGDKQCCPLYHRSIEMVGKRWTGAILMVLMEGPLRFSEIGGTVPDV